MRRRKASFLDLFCLAAIFGASACEAAEPALDPVEKELVKLGEEYRRLEEDERRQLGPNEVSEYSNAEFSDEEWLNRMGSASPSPDERLLPGFLELAELHADSPFALDALCFAIRRRGSTVNVHGATWQAGERAIDLVAQHHLDDPRMTLILGLLSFQLPSKKAESLLRTALGEGPDRATRAAAGLSLARYIQTQGHHHKMCQEFKRKSRLTNLDRTLKVFMTPYLEREYPYDPDKASAEIETLLALVIEEYRDVSAGNWAYAGPLKVLVRPDKVAERKTYGELARALLFELNHLVPGKQAPDIEGRDADGNTFRLSDYRGKVVLLTFSANWCGPCRKLYPLERQLVEKFRDDAFAMLSVSMDEKVDTLQASLASGEITWRCWWDGLDGPIYKTWNSPDAPTILLLDERGIIQDVRLNRTTPREEFEHAITELLSKAPALETSNR